VRFGGVVVEGLDEDELVRIIEAARPVEPFVAGSARVASVNSRVMSGHWSANSGLTGNFTTMKITVVLLFLFC
jgi:hypothetical protein